MGGYRDKDKEQCSCSVLTPPKYLPCSWVNRELKYIMLHCSATPIFVCKKKDGSIVRYSQTNAPAVVSFHFQRKETETSPPWNRPGYSKIIEYDGQFNIDINAVRRDIKSVLPQIEEAIFSYSLGRNYEGQGKNTWVYATAEPGSRTVKINESPSIVFSTVDERKISGKGEYFDTIVSDAELTYGAGNYNQNSLHICYIGGTVFDPKAPQSPNPPPLDTRTEKQKLAMEVLVRYYLYKYNSRNIKVIGHNQVDCFTQRVCPSFWVADWLRKIGISEEFIEEKDPFGIKEFVMRINEANSRERGRQLYDGVDAPPCGC